MSRAIKHVEQEVPVARRVEARRRGRGRADEATTVDVGHGAPGSRPDPLRGATTAEVVLRILVGQGVRRAYGIPGGPLLPVIRALAALAPASGRAASPAMASVLTKTEAGALFMADGDWRVSNVLPLVFATAGPGTTNLTTAAAVALRDGVPVFIVTAWPPLATLGKGNAQELDTVRVLAGVVKEAHLLSDPGQARGATERLIRVALTGRPGPVLLCLPQDIAALADS